MKNGFKKLEKNALGCMYTATGLLSIVLMLVVTIPLLYFELLKIKIILFVYIGIMVIAVLDAIISPYFRYHRYCYKLDNEAMEIIEGYIFISHSIVPIERIQSIELKQGPIDRLFKVSKMILTTGGTDVTVRFVSKSIAEDLSNSLKKNVNIIAKENGEE